MSGMMTSVNHAAEAHAGGADTAADQQTLLILGASGDLTARLLLPGLGRLAAVDGPGRLSLVGSGM
jgi:glucose-6-phosphate 1-dehydrogenase